MKNYYKYTLLAVALLFSFSFVNAQSISGRIFNQNGEPIPFANIYVNELQTGTSSDGEGYFFMTLNAGGEYEVVFSSIGYETKIMKVVVEDKPLKLDIRMKTSSVEMDEIVVKALKRDSSYLIVRKVIENKKQYLKSVESFKSEVYVKATEVIKRTPKQKKEEAEKKEEDIDNLGEKEVEIDPFAEQRKEEMALLSSLNMVEMQLTLNYQYPKKYKEERTAYKKSGSKAGLFIPLFGELDFNFYRNMVFMEAITETPIISPVSSTAILAYKYKLIETRNEGGQIVYKIKVIPRKKGNATVRGHIYINEGIWNINRLELSLSKSGLKFFDAFELNMKYEQVGDSIWIPTRQEFNYQTKEGRFKTFKGNTVLLYSDYQHNYEFPSRFFGNEVVKITKEAYKKDSTFWSTTRPEPLTDDEMRMVQLRDSIYSIINSDEYQDSITRAYNKVTLLEVFWEGIGYRDHRKKTLTYTGPIPSLINYSIIGGWRTGPFFFHSKRWENGKRISINAQATYGFKNQDFQGNVGTFYRYNPHKLADVRFGAYRSFQSINQFDAYLNQLRVSNYILNDGIYLGHRIELINGVYFDARASFNDRKSLEDYQSESGLANWIAGITEVEAEPISFEPYQALISNMSISWTPFQKFMTEPNRKVVLNSKFPTFRLLHRKGWKNVFSSDVDFDYLELSINHDVTIGTLGNSKYTAQLGQFINSKGLPFIDYKRFRQSDPYLYSNPLYSFQALDTSLNTTRLFFEAHWIHHFNGALINNLPLIKKTNIRLVAGGGFLWATENNLRHEEIFAGVERIFKLGARRRIRIGLYGVLANSNFGPPDTAYKFSIDIIDTWKRDWNF